MYDAYVRNEDVGTIFVQLHAGLDCLHQYMYKVKLLITFLLLILPVFIPLLTFFVFITDTHGLLCGRKPVARKGGTSLAPGWQ